MADAIRGLPLRLGGLGLRRLHDLADVAFTSSFLRAASSVPACSPLLLQLLEEHADKVADVVAVVERITPHHVTRAGRRVTLTAWASAREDRGGVILPEIPSQRHLLEQDETRMLESTLSELANGGDRASGAWVRSSGFKGSGKWLLAPTQATSATCRLAESEFRVNLLLRLGVRPSWATAAEGVQCACCREAGDGDQLDPLYHGLNCAGLSGRRIRRHNFVRDCVADLLRRLFGGHAVSTEMRLETPGSATVVADIALQTGGGLRLFDVAIPNPAANSALARQSDTTVLAAARVAEVEKRAHYRAALAHRGLADTAFIPFVVEATGRLGSAAETFLDQVITYPDLQAEDAIGTVRFSIARLQTLIARGNAIAIGAFSRGARVVG